MIWLWYYLALGLGQVFFNLGRSMHIEFLQRQDWTELKRGGGRVEHVQERKWTEFLVSIVFVWLLWLPLWILHGFFVFQGWRNSREFERIDQIK